MVFRKVYIIIVFLLNSLFKSFWYDSDYAQGIISTFQNKFPFLGIYTALLVLLYYV